MEIVIQLIDENKKHFKLESQFETKLICWWKLWRKNEVINKLIITLSIS